MQLMTLSDVSLMMTLYPCNFAGVASAHVPVIRPWTRPYLNVKFQPYMQGAADWHRNRLCWIPLFHLHEVTVLCHRSSALDNVQVVDVITHILTCFNYISEIGTVSTKKRPSKSRNGSPVAGSIQVSPFVTGKVPDILSPFVTGKVPDILANFLGSLFRITR